MTGTALARLYRRGRDWPSTGGRDRIVWLDPPIRLPGARLLVLGYDAATDLPDWLTAVLADRAEAR